MIIYEGVGSTLVSTAFKFGINDVPKCKCCIESYRLPLVDYQTPH